MNYKNRMQLQLIKKYRCTTAEISHDFTGLVLNMLTKYSSLEIRMFGSVTGAADLKITLNGATSGFRSDQIHQDTTTISGIQNASTAAWEIIPAEILDVSGRNFLANITITSLGIDADKFAINAQCGAPNEGIIITIGDFDLTSSAGIITSILFALSANTWNIGTEILIYGTLR